MQSAVDASMIRAYAARHFSALPNGGVMNRERILQVVLVAVGLIFLAWRLSAHDVPLAERLAVAAESA